MVSDLTRVTQTPITAFVITAAMTDNRAMVIPLVIAALTADAASMLIEREALSHLGAVVF